MMKLLRLLFCWLLAGCALTASAQNIPARPTPPKLVNDLAGVLTPDQAARLEAQLIAYDDSTSNQVAIVTVPTLNDYPIEEYALKLFRAWGIGNKKTNNGILILVATDDRKMRIEVGYGLEGAIPDITANHIIQNDLAPNFRSGDYYEGFQQAAQSVIKAAAGEYKAPANYRKKGNRGTGAWIGFLVIIIIVIISSINNRGGGGGFMSRRGYRSGLGPFIWGSAAGWGAGGGGGGGWSGGGGGGFGGFGGGSSGGGGASGSW